MTPEQRADRVAQHEPLIESGSWAIVKRGAHHFVASMNDAREIQGLTFFPAELALIVRQLKNKAAKPARAAKGKRV